MNFYENMTSETKIIKYYESNVHDNSRTLILQCQFMQLSHADG